MSAMTQEQAWVERLGGWLDEHAGELVNTIVELVRIPSMVGQESEAQAFMQAQYLAAGLDVDVFEADYGALSRHPAFVDSGIPFAGRPNVVGLWAGVGGGRSLILNGHTDVVSPASCSPAPRHRCDLRRRSAGDMGACTDAAPRT